jgi:hypothetical protein
MNNPVHISESLETSLWVKKLKFFDVVSGSGIKKFGSGINIPNATLVPLMGHGL